MSLRIDLTDPALFGNDAAEDEHDDVFASYVVERPEVAAFLQQNRLICIARALKGEGKSALLRITRERLEVDSPPLIVRATGKQLSPVVQSVDTDEWVREWKRSILQLVAREIGATVGFAWTDDAISLVEEAERSGYKSRSLVSAVFDRLKSKAVPLERSRVEMPDPERVVQRWADRTDGIWIFVDDVDENFQNIPEYRAKVASFFLAVREISNAIPQVRFRLAIRPNTWATIAPEFESLSKVEQYNIELRWSEGDIRDLLAARVRGYLTRTGQHADAAASLKGGPRAADYISLVFEDPMQWGRRTRPPHVPVATLSRRRPRWAIELSREAAAAAQSHGHARIGIDDIVGCLEAFGKRRIADTIAEFGPQCAQLGELIAAFSRQAEEYATDELIKTIDQRVLQSVKPKIAGVLGTPRPVEVGAFLFQIGFLSARRPLEGEQYEHITFSEQPGLLRDRTNIDDGVRWEIHPVFRQALQLRDASGRPVRKPPRDKRGR